MSKAHEGVAILSPFLQFLMLFSECDLPRVMCESKRRILKISTSRDHWSRMKFAVHDVFRTIVWSYDCTIVWRAGVCLSTCMFWRSMFAGVKMTGRSRCRQKPVVMTGVGSELKWSLMKVLLRSKPSNFKIMKSRMKIWFYRFSTSNVDTCRNKYDLDASNVTFRIKCDDNRWRTDPQVAHCER